MIDLPIAVINGTTILRITHSPEQFTGPDGVQHPASAWTDWTPDDWRAKVPGWTLAPVVTAPRPDDTANLITGQTQTLEGGMVTLGWSSRPLTADELAAALATAQAAALAQVDRDAETARQAYATPGSGQAMAYQEKAAEAKAYQAVITAGQTPQAADYPHLAAEVGITGPDMAAVAAKIAAATEVWAQASARIEAIRLGGKDAIRKAGSVAAVTATLAALVWPKP